MKNKIRLKTFAMVFALLIMAGALGAVTYATVGNKDAGNTEKKTEKKTESIIDTTSVAKDETVYVLAKSDGTVKKVIVSDWLKNSAKGNIKDKSDLDDVKNVKGEESYSMNPDNMRVWDAEGDDIYYQGTSKKTLPVDIAISYRLNGEPVSAEDLAGKSGKVTMRFDYTNNVMKSVKVGNKKENMYVPFLMLTGTVLDNSKFSNIEVSNGKLISDGDKSVIVGFALPGLQQNLKLNKSKLEIPSYVEITADVKDFRLETTLTVATNDIFSQVDLSKVKTVDQLTDALGDLEKASKELVDGSSQLYGGLTTLLNKSGQLISGVDQLATGAKVLDNGAKKIKTGTAELNSGLGKLVENNDALNGGAEKVFKTLLQMADENLEAAGLDVPKLTIDNYNKVLSSILKSLDKEAVRKQATETAKAKVTEAVEANRPVIKAQVEKAVSEEVLKAVLKKAGIDMSVDNYYKAVEAGKIPAETSKMINAEVEKQMNTDSIKATVKSQTDNEVEKIIKTQMVSQEVQSQINMAVAKAEAGSTSIKSLKDQLDEYNVFYTGLAAYTKGVEDAYVGSGKLQKGTVDLSKGTNSLYSGILTLKSGSDTLIDGVGKLQKGSMQLSKGMKEFDKKGISKLVSAVDGDVKGLIDRMKATVNVSKSYQNYSGLSDGMDGNVKFIYRTDEISVDKDK